MHSPPMSMNSRPRAPCAPAPYLDERPDGALYQAAAAGRADVVGTGGSCGLQRAVGNGGSRRLVDGGGVLDVLWRRAATRSRNRIREDMEADWVRTSVTCGCIPSATPTSRRRR